MMDSNKASTSMPNSMKPECDNDKNKNYKTITKHGEQSNNDGKVFTSTANAGSNYVPLNGAHSRLVNVVSHESVSQSSRPTENATEDHKNLPSTSNPLSGKLNPTDSFHGSITACSSKSSLNTNNGLDIDGQSCLRHRVCIAGSSNVPSTSGTSRADSDNIVLKENRKRPSSLKLNRLDVDDDSSTDTGNDDYSLGSEDGCIYTYRGGEHLADLPSSFFSLDMGLPLDRHLPVPPNYAVAQGAGNPRDGGSRASSPDMDFLEMDFDPGPSCEVDSGDESSPDTDLDADLNMQEENDPIVNAVRGTSPEYSAPPARMNPMPANILAGPQGDENSQPKPSTSREMVSSEENPTKQAQHTWYGPYITHVNARGELLMVRRTMLHWAGPVNIHSNGDVTPLWIPTHSEDYTEDPESSTVHTINCLKPMADLNLPVGPSAMYHMIMAKKLLADIKKDDENQTANNMGLENAEAGPSSSGANVSCVEPPRCMIWSEREACERQVTQISTSACGATAVLNVFNALGVPVNIERINQSVGTRLRANTAPIPRYLLSRAVAGCTAAELVAGIHRASDGLVTARFFATYPERAMSLSHWLADWISLGAVPILTQNLQNGCEGDMPDAWHHQMVFGVSPRGVYLCNPVECVRETMLWPRLASPSSLLVRASDVFDRFTNTTDLTPLLHVPDPRFETYNVLGQVVNVIREWCAAKSQQRPARTRFIRIPAAYQAGITIAALTGSEAHRRLMIAAHLPILNPQNDPA